jgi:hypothetical protein
MKKPRTLQFAVAGAFLSSLLAAVGHRMDLAVPALRLDQQVLYNWIALILSPASFLLRLRNPDGPIVPGFLFAAAAIALNALWYATVRSIYVVVAQPANLRPSVSSPALALTAGSSGPLPSRLGSSSERLADCCEHRLCAKHSDHASVEDASAAVLAETTPR